MAQKDNSSYGLTICAERTAIFCPVAQEGGDRMRIRAVVVVKQKGTYCPPCGACRQVIFEFGTQTSVLLQEKDNPKQFSMGELLPGAFELK